MTADTHILITPKEFEIRMRKLQYEIDGEPVMYDTHFAVDELLCEVLKSLGYEAGIKIFEESDKWYE